MWSLILQKTSFWPLAFTSQAQPQAVLAQDILPLCTFVSFVVNEVEIPAQPSPRLLNRGRKS
jgi:hypothetical protein